MKTNEQARQPMDNWVKAGFAKERDETTREVFKRAIGTNGNRSSWRGTTSLHLTAMEMAILDTMYDAGKGAEFKPKDLLNDHTRMAYIIDEGWAIHFVPDRKQESCGHDERDCVHYKLYEHYEDDGCYSGWNRRIIKEWYTDEEGCITYDELEALAEEQHEKEKHYLTKNGSPLWHSASRYSYFSTDDYRGECAWKRGCKHHHSRHHEHALIRLVDKESGHQKQFLRKPRWGRYEQLDDFDLLYWDEQDHEAMLADVNDKDVVAHIRATIPKMKTEARPWLRSTWVEHTDYNQELQCWNKVHHGKRGVYQLHWWGWDKRVRQELDITAEYDKLKGTNINGWMFRSNGAHGNWEADVPTWIIVPNDYGYRRTGYEMRFLHKGKADTMLKQLNSAHRLVSHYNSEGEPADEFARVEEDTKRIHLSNDHAELCAKYTPLEYFAACHSNLLDEGEPNAVCTHMEE